MKIPEEIAEKVSNGTMEEVYNIFITLEGEYKNFDKEYDMVRYGIDVYFEIHDLWERTPNIKIRAKEGKVLIGKKAYGISEYRTEKEERRKMMTQAIIENTSNKIVEIPR